MKKYNHTQIESKWQKYWQEKKIFQSRDFSKKKKQYVLVEFPYPSGEGLHMGHLRPYTAGDVYSRFLRLQGNEVLFPIGWDAFGLPAENYALKQGVHPSITTKKNIANAKRQLQSWGLSFDWSREINTTDPDYYKWTQWLFLQFYKAGLAYEATGLINWCPKDKTGLANEEVIDGRCERCGTVVEKKELRQWYLKITAYAEKLLEGLKTLNEWPQAVKLQQENWIGKSVGAEIEFTVSNKWQEISDKKRNYLILHGYTGRTDKNFLPWLKLEIEKRGYKVQMPQMPNTEHPRESEQLEYVLKNCKVDQNTIIIGHSLGTVVAMKVLQKINKPIAGLVLVAPAIDPKFHHAESRPFWKTFSWENLDYKKLKNLTQSIYVLSDLQEVHRKEYLEFLAEKLNAKLITGQAQRKHFCALQEPIILEAIYPSIKVFTTRPDTIFGATYLVVAPEHGVVENFKSQITNYNHVREYIKQSERKSELDRGSEGKEKTGVELKGIKAINPATKEEIPVWVADYVLGDYGTGAIMAVPAHDRRDFEFAQKFNLPIKKVIDKTKYLIFDFDGVIGDTFEAAAQSRLAMGADENLTVARREVIEYASKKPIHTRDHTLTPEQLEQQHEWTKRFGTAMSKQNIRLFNEFVTEIIKIQNAKIAIVSSGSALYVEPGIKKSKLKPTHIFSYETHHSKEEKIEKICKDWGVALTDVYYFTDSKADVFELKDFIAKEKIIGCAWGYLGQKELETVLPKNQILENYSDIHALFESLHTDSGVLINSGEFNGTESDRALLKMGKKFGALKTQYKLRDWVFSRQRYWGEPIPIIHCPECGIVPVPEKDLPIKLPPVKKYEPTGTGESPLAAIKNWVNVKCPKCKQPAKRETNTMPQWAGSSWYWLRYTDPTDIRQFAEKKKQQYWTPVDTYFGGMEHTTLHLLYSRFWNLFLYDQKLVTSKEPFTLRKPHGIILAADGEKMSKSRGNVVNPDEIVSTFGADTLRMYELFLGPHEMTVSWNDNGILGVRRFLDRVWNWANQVQGAKGRVQNSEQVDRIMNKLIKKITEDLETFSFNTCVSAFMEAHNQLKDEAVSKESVQQFLVLLYPFAPHISEELSQMLGGKKSVQLSSWPKYDQSKIAESTAEIVVQVNGKMKGKISVASGSSEATVKKEAMNLAAVGALVKESAIRRVIFVPERLINFVV